MPADSPDAHDSLHAKVVAIFAEFAGERAERLSAVRAGTAANDAVLTALDPEFGLERANDIGFHLADWGADAAFIVALHLCPERFTAEEVQAGVGLFLCHVPNHVVAAAALASYPIDDTFGVLPTTPNRTA